MENHNLFLEVAHRIGVRLAKQAQWNEGRCTWEVPENDPRDPGAGQTIVEMTSGSVYRGTAGVAWFLSELAQVTGETVIKEAAKGAILHAVAAIENTPTDVPFGLHSGHLGVAYVAARAASMLQAPALLEDAERILARMEHQEHTDTGLDVIKGAAGAIPALLQLRTILPADRMLGMAVRLGDQLIRTAHKEPIGWSWPSRMSKRHLLGLAHGAAGYAQGLLELFHVTGSTKYLYAAEQAFLYERHFFNPQHANWPDFRDGTLSDYIMYRRPEDLETLLASPTTSHKYMSAWCHGAPGVGLARLRAYQLLQHACYLKETEAAIASTLATFHFTEGHYNYSLCHGYSGNSDVLLQAAEVLGHSELREKAEIVALKGWERYEKAGLPWPCGTPGTSGDPSLMLGEAGIGLFFLRLHNPSIISPLLLCASKTEGDPTAVINDHQELQNQYINHFFGRTRHIVEARDPLVPSIVRPFEPCQEASDVEVAQQTLAAYIEKHNDTERAMLEDAFKLEKARFEMTRALKDFTKEFVDRLRLNRETIEIEDQDRFMISPVVRFVISRWDWDTWLKQENPLENPEEEETAFILTRKDNAIRIDQLSPLAEIVLDTLKTPADTPEAIASILQTTEVTDPAKQAMISQHITDQIKQAFREGIIDIVSPHDATITA